MWTFKSLIEWNMWNIYVYFGTCHTMQDSETMNNGSEKEDLTCNQGHN